jgi:hypothetical protein
MLFLKIPLVILPYAIILLHPKLLLAIFGYYELFHPKLLKTIYLCYSSLF